MFAYCTRVLRLSEHAAYGRIEAARCARRCPLVLEALTAGEITLTTITLLAPHLTDDNHRAVLEEAHHLGRRDVERIVARLRPQPDVVSAVRRLPDPPARPAAPGSKAAAQPPAATSGTVQPDSSLLGDAAAQPIEPAALPACRDTVSSRPAVKPLSPARYSLTLTIGQDAHDMLARAQALLRHAVPDGDPAVVFERALRALLRELERSRLAATSRPRRASPVAAAGRRVPAAVRRAVWARDHGRCAFVGADGRRCDETAFLELHHLVPFADGGLATVENLSVRCKSA
jgi:hypothetical protein